MHSKPCLQPSFVIVFLIIQICTFHLAVVNAQPKSNDPKPNIVFIISDQHKLSESGAYGSATAITPNIDKLAETGITFMSCYTPAPVCAPARAALITGMNPYANGAIYHKTPLMIDGKRQEVGSGELRMTGYKEGIITLAESLKSAGYLTAAPGKMHVHGELQKGVDPKYPDGNFMGFDEISVRYYTYFPGGHYEDIVGKDTYERYRQFGQYKDVYKGGADHVNQEYVPTLVQNDEDNFDMVVAQKAVEFIDSSAKSDQPFFIHIGFEKPHAPFTTTQKYLDMHDPSAFSLPETYTDWYEKGRYPWVPNWIHSGIPKELNKAQNVMAAYNACITEMDDMIGRVIQALKDNGEYENTVIIYTADHGEHLFEHGLRGKHCMYEEAVNIPFIVSYPKGFKSGIKVNSLVSLIDVYPTLCELVGVEIPQTVQGVSLLSTLTEGKELGNRTIFSEFRGADYELLPKVRNVPSRMLRTGNYKFIYTHGIMHQLYDLKKDPNELVNLVGDPSYSDRILNFYFQTMAEWRFQEYSPIPTAVSKNMLQWETTANFSTYSIFYSDQSDPTNAKQIAKGISTNQITMKRRGYYWVLADIKLTKTTPRYGNELVAVDAYNFILPISDPVKF